MFAGVALLALSNTGYTVPFQCSDRASAPSLSPLDCRLRNACLVSLLAYFRDFAQGYFSVGASTAMQRSTTTSSSMSTCD